MDRYVTGAMIKKLREDKKLTQSQLAEKLCISEKTVSKWETGRGYPDISILEELAAALGISVIELMAGRDIANGNPSFNMLRLKFYVCPVCGNIITAAGEAVISCHGVTLPPLEAEAPDEAHMINVEVSEDEYYITLNHEMTRRHFISFITAVRDNGFETVKLYPEGAAECRFKINRVKEIYCFCNRHGLFKLRLPHVKRQAK